MRVIAVDWSGAMLDARRRIWLAETADQGCLTRLEAGRTRLELTVQLISTLRRDSETVLGLDFAFSFPAWFTRQLGVQTAKQVWAHAAAHGEQWLADCLPPFWGRGARGRPLLDGPHYRRTERDVPSHSGIRPKSIFQIGGAGAVGTGSVRGMPLLHALHTAGAHVWPFDAPGWPLVIEIYPRLLTGAVVKSSASARQAYLERYPRLGWRHRRDAIASEDAFDAAVSALVMLEHVVELAQLPEELDPELRLEGRIWHPTSHRGEAK